MIKQDLKDKNKPSSPVAWPTFQKLHLQLPNTFMLAVTMSILITKQCATAAPARTPRRRPLPQHTTAVKSNGKKARCSADETNRTIEATDALFAPGTIGRGSGQTRGLHDYLRPGDLVFVSTCDDGKMPSWAFVHSSIGQAGLNASEIVG